MKAFHSWGISCRGRREENQDAICLAGRSEGQDESVIAIDGALSEDYHLFAIADGVGGRPNVRWAAHTALQALPGVLKSCTSETIGGHLRNASSALSDPTALGLGPATTVAGLYLGADGGTAFNLGDSRVYLLDLEGPRLLSVDHISKTDNRSITRYLGGPAALTAAHYRPFSIDGEGAALLASDGLYAFLSDSDLTLPLELDPSLALRSLVQLALSNGSRDNLSAVFIQWHD